MTIAFVFPGQGAQYAGMGKAIAAASEHSRQVFQRADAALGFALSALCWEGPEALLRQTENTQPAILATSVACWAALQARGVAPAMAAGLSVGEYAALVCTRAISLEDALTVVRRRGVLMAEAAAGRRTAMAAILGLGASAIRQVCQAAAVHGIVEPSNFNSPGQIVIAGDEAAVQHAIRLAKAAGARRAVPLPVSAPFHTSLMRPAAQRLAEVLADVTIHPPSVPVISNVTAQPVRHPEEIRRLLIEQVASAVRWDESVSAMAAAGIDTFVAIGPGTTLSGLIRKIVPSAHVAHVADPSSLDETMRSLEPAVQGTADG